MEIITETVIAVNTNLRIANAMQKPSNAKNYQIGIDSHYQNGNNAIVSTSNPSGCAELTAVNRSLPGPNGQVRRVQRGIYGKPAPYGEGSTQHSRVCSYPQPAEGLNHRQFERGNSSGTDSPRVIEPQASVKGEETKYAIRRVNTGRPVGVGPRKEMTMRAYLMSALLVSLSGCAAPVIQEVDLDAGDGVIVHVIEHINEDTPDECMKMAGGCFKSIDGVKHIWYPGGPSNYCIRDHERAHAMGMRHTPWARSGARWTAVVTHSGGGFEIGQVLHGCT